MIMAKKMKTYFYQFEDGYFCYTAGKLGNLDMRYHIKEHGKLITMKIC